MLIERAMISKLFARLFTSLHYREGLGVGLLLLLLASCSSDDISLSPSVTTHTCKVAVLMHKSEQARWESTAQWALQNIAEAQRGMTDRIQLELTFKDQDADDIADYMQQRPLAEVVRL